jgi:hypothetical protein
MKIRSLTHTDKSDKVAKMAMTMIIGLWDGFAKRNFVCISSSL